MSEAELPDRLTPEEIEAGRLLFAAPCAFFFGAQHVDQLPPPDRPEIAFAGRSNVGKSSLINALTGRTRLARSSSEPGRTKQLNFFDLGGRVTLVDMPGYGFAKAAKAVKEDWQQTMFAYLRGRPTLARVLLLLDARIELKASDREVMELLDRAAVVFQVVLTKCDAVKPGALAAKNREVSAEIGKHPAAYPVIVETSNETGLGVDILRASIARVIAEAPSGESS
ncbi:ribosome biogenesis GTP-binding protein YihA/YsxC [Acidomonas methanolica]|uniref:Probable GTP-binding protein EngB n=1 Tax=Acidomonas methanolica NBRC 104435 TaxID=1231351 RepID=A0A023D083_ACIMT|nr:ribosome biogenesis GTP-binding protein YihA/YsxC [Acidomonas methanolica]MBU2653897.1 ribosome biogenesis GTP-binding protein YihA/YsxC [Acidomonas methanolica]TCS30857.1 GTP-binding protein [Acidomonas methanolica]GAJ27578.1 ribosome biogenesis GTP-binding protein YsxC [Acidomonas methanolica NBRC 104435]GBQ57130.1 ribosome biogenesis GTP-binding protein YsxC [Acidomonas methanolica]GEK98346.1 putative GTP-binding protein EngB [Acidomonas methanolica NBRC 104435]